jgi:hypothetical protein
MHKLISGLDNPIKLAILLLIAGLLAHVFSLVFYAIEDDTVNFSHWIVASTILLLYAFFNSVYLLKTKDLTTYFRRSVYGFLILLVSGFGLATAFSQLERYEQRSVRWILFMIIFSYFIFLTIAFFLRKIIEYAQRQDTESKS